MLKAVIGSYKVHILLLSVLEYAQIEISTVSLNAFQASDLVLQSVPDGR